MERLSLKPLTKVRALVTRPKAQAEALVQAIKARSGHVCALPMLEILPLEESQSMRDQILSLDNFDHIIVTSAHAAHFGCEIIDIYWPQMPVGLVWHAIGAATAHQLSHYGIDAHTCKTGIDSEALLTHPSLIDINKRKVLLIKGQGGRQLISSTLRDRGAEVHILDVYQRKAPIYPPGTLANTLASQKINVILCSSGEIVSNLITMLPTVCSLPLTLIVPSQRVAREAKKSGFCHVLIANGASNQAMLDVLEQQVNHFDRN